MKHTILLVFLAGCAEPVTSGEHVTTAPLGEREGALAVDCGQSTATGYSNGAPFTITVVHVDGKPVEVATANAFCVMAQAAAASGVQIGISSGFRTMAEQE